MGLAVTAVGTVVSRRRHRILHGLVSVRSEEAPGALLLEDPRATAYCLPGVRSRIVVSAGVLGVLDRGQQAAALGHEPGHVHVHERHDLVMCRSPRTTALPGRTSRGCNGCSIPGARPGRVAAAAGAGAVPLVAAPLAALVLA